MNFILRAIILEILHHNNFYYYHLIFLHFGTKHRIMRISITKQDLTFVVTSHEFYETRLTLILYTKRPPGKHTYINLKKKVREKSRECHIHKA